MPNKLNSSDFVPSLAAIFDRPNSILDELACREGGAEVLRNIISSTGQEKDSLLRCICATADTEKRKNLICLAIWPLISAKMRYTLIVCGILFCTLPLFAALVGQALGATAAGCFLTGFWNAPAGKLFPIGFFAGLIALVATGLYLGFCSDLWVLRRYSKTIVQVPSSYYRFRNGAIMITTLGLILAVGTAIWAFNYKKLELARDGIAEIEESKGIDFGAHFKGGNVSFDYPKNWVAWQKTSFERVRSFLKSQGVDLLVMWETKDEACTIQVVKQRNPSSFNLLYEDKKKFADEVTAKGIEIMGERYVRYSVSIVVLDNGQKAILVHAEKSNGETGISYQFLSDDYEYNVNFIYKSASAAAKDEKLREKVMRTFKILGSKTTTVKFN